MRYLLALLLISTIMATTGTSIAAAQTATPTPAPTPVYSATPVHDTGVSETSPTTNYSILSALYYRKQAGQAWITYVYPGIPTGSVNAATLWLFAPSANNISSAEVHQTWPVDNTTTWITRPPSLGLIEIITPTVGWNSIDITATVQQGRGIMLQGRTSTVGWLRSMETGTAPYVTYSLYPTPTPSATATPSPSAQRLALPSGGIAEATATITYGDIITSGLLVFLIAIGLWVLSYMAAQRGGLRR